MGVFLTLNERLENASVRSQFVTAYLNVTYAKPVPTPATIMVTAKIKEIKGRKHFFEATISDGDGLVLAKGESLYIEIKEPKTKL